MTPIERFWMRLALAFWMAAVIALAALASIEIEHHGLPWAREGQR